MTDRGPTWIVLCALAPEVASTAVDSLKNVKGVVSQRAAGVDKLRLEAPGEILHRIVADPDAARCYFRSSAARAASQVGRHSAIKVAAIWSMLAMPRWRGAPAARLCDMSKIGYASTSATLTAVMARSSQRSRVARSVHASMRT